MILLKDKKFKTYFKIDIKTNINIENILLKLKRLIKKYEKCYNFDYFVCPNCKSDKCMYYGSYTRNIGLLGEYCKIKIKRVRCKSCKRTHALIPQFIIPYFQNEITYILSIIKEVVVNKETVNNVSRLSNQDRKLISFFIKRFKRHITRLITTFKKKIVYILKLLKVIENREKYELQNHIRFLEKVPT